MMPGPKPKVLIILGPEPSFSFAVATMIVAEESGEKRRGNEVLDGGVDNERESRLPRGGSAQRSSLFPEDSTRRFLSC
jgi:hypothetical protein